MDVNKFSDKSPGRIVQIAAPSRPSKQDWAFVPEELSSRWDFDGDLWPLVVEAREALGKLDGRGQSLPDPELLLRPLQAAESISSSRIEGTYVTPQQLLLFELSPRDSDSQRDDMGAWLEVFHYTRALHAGHNLLSGKAALPICNRVIQKMHRVLMEGARAFSSSPGEYRKLQVQIGSEGRFIPPPPEEVEPLMKNFEDYSNFLTGDGCDPLVRAFIAHYQFEAIHPFQDGNGRIGRALLALMVSKWLGHSMPWLYLSAYFDKYKNEYIDKLFNVSSKGEWAEWIRFCLFGTIVQSYDSIRRCDELISLRKQYILLPGETRHAHRIIEKLFSSPVVTVKSAQDLCGTTYNTAIREIRALVDAGVLQELSNIRPRSFFAPKIMDAAFGDPPAIPPPPMPSPRERLNAIRGVDSSIETPPPF